MPTNIVLVAIGNLGNRKTIGSLGNCGMRATCGGAPVCWRWWAIGNLGQIVREKKSLAVDDHSVDSARHCSYCTVIQYIIIFST